MRIDNFLSDLGIIKRRTIAKEIADAGHITINDRRAKPGSTVKAGDIIMVSSQKHITLKVIKVPEGKSVSKDRREEYYTIIEGG